MRGCKRVEENVVEMYVTSVVISFKIDSGFRRVDASDFLATREGSSTRVMPPCRRGWRKCCWMPRARVETCPCKRSYLIKSDTTLLRSSTLVTHNLVGSTLAILRHLQSTCFTVRLQRYYLIPFLHKCLFQRLCKNICSFVHFGEDSKRLSSGFQIGYNLVGSK